MDHVSLGARELSRTRANGLAQSSFTAGLQNSSANCSLETASSLSDVLFRQEPHNAARRLLPIMVYTKRRGRMPIADDENSNSWQARPGRRILCRAFASAGDEVVVLTRKANPECSYRYVRWDASRWRLGEGARGRDGCHSLAGRSVNCRYGKKNRREILDSR